MITDNLKKTFVTATILTLLAGLIVTQISTTNALEFDTAIFIAVSPNPIGINQQVAVTSIMPNVPPPQFPDYRPRYGYWNDITLTITKPDGTTESKTGLSTFEAGTGYYLYTPTMIGEYQLQYSFPGQTIAKHKPYHFPYSTRRTNRIYSRSAPADRLLANPNIWRKSRLGDYCRKLACCRRL
jgi:hypothetical protein